MPTVRVSDASTDGDAFAGVVGRLLLTQGEMRRLLGSEAATAVLPDRTATSARAEVVAAALSEALELVGDDELVGAWLRSSLPRRGGASPMEEAERVDGELPLRFVLRPHPNELVRLVSDRAAAALGERLGHRDPAGA